MVVMQFLTEQNQKIKLKYDQMKSISTNVRDRTGIELATPGSAVRHASLARHVTDCATQPGSVASQLGSCFCKSSRYA